MGDADDMDATTPAATMPLQPPSSNPPLLHTTPAARRRRHALARAPRTLRHHIPPPPLPPATNDRSCECMVVVWWLYSFYFALRWDGWISCFLSDRFGVGATFAVLKSVLDGWMSTW